jgi:hypothetical protein
LSVTNETSAGTSSFEAATLNIAVPSSTSSNIAPYIIVLPAASARSTCRQ